MGSVLFGHKEGGSGVQTKEEKVWNPSLLCQPPTACALGEKGKRERLRGKKDWRSGKGDTFNQRENTRGDWRSHEHSTRRNIRVAPKGRRITLSPHLGGRGGHCSGKKNLSRGNASERTASYEKGGGRHYWGGGGDVFSEKTALQQTKETLPSKGGNCPFLLYEKKTSIMRDWLI